MILIITKGSIMNFSSSRVCYFYECVISEQV